MKIKRFPFLMKWIATIVIFMVFLGFAGNFFMGNLFMFGSSSNDPNRYYVAIVFGLVTGFGISIAQVAVAGKVLSQKYRLLWVLAGVVGFLVGFSLMVSLFSAAKHYQNVLTTFLIAAFISGGTSGLVTGILQWLSLKDTYQLAYRWILANVIAGIISYLARWSWLIFLHDHLGDCSFSLAFDVFFFDGISSVVAGILFSLVTGLSLFSIVQSGTTLLPETTDQK